MQKLQQEDLNDSRISIYGSGNVTPEAFAHGVVKIKKAFPKLPETWYDILDEALDAEDFTDERFKDAVWYLIRTCVYPEPTIANILGYDKKVQVYTMRELQKKHADSYYPGSRSDPINDEYAKIELNGELRLVKKEDFNPVRFKIWNYRK